MLVYRRWTNDDILIIALNFPDNDLYVPVPFGHAGVWIDVLEASYGNQKPYSKSVADS